MKGTYLLIMKLPKKTSLMVGKLGVIQFKDRIPPVYSERSEW
jgi:hypothetical protein